MSSSESQIQFQKLLEYSSADASLDLCLAGIQVFMWIYMTSFLTDVPSSTRTRRLPYILVSLIVLILSSASAILVMIFQHSALYNIPGGEWNLREALAAYNQRYDELFLPAGLLHDVAVRVGEVLLVYRCYIIWYDRPWVAAVPACCLLAGIGINIRTWIPFDFENAQLNDADTSITITVNVLVTLLISFRLIRAQMNINKVLPDSDSRKIYLGVVAILVESATPVTVFGIGFLITRSLFKNSGSFVTYQANNVLGMLFDISAILAPQLIIFRVATGTSWSGKADTSALFSQSIRFNDHAHGRSRDEENSRMEDSETSYRSPEASEKNSK